MFPATKVLYRFTIGTGATPEIAIPPPTVLLVFPVNVLFTIVTADPESKYKAPPPSVPTAVLLTNVQLLIVAAAVM